MKISSVLLYFISFISPVFSEAVDNDFNKKYDPILLVNNDSITVNKHKKFFLINKTVKSGMPVRQSNGEFVKKDIFYQETQFENLLVNISYLRFDTYGDAYAAAQSMAEEASVKYTKGICRETKDTKLWSDSWCTDMMGGLAYIIVDGALCLHICALSNQATPFEEKQAILMEMIKIILERKHASFE